MKWLTLIAVAGLVFSGCGKTSTPPSASPSTPATSAPAVTEAPAASMPAAPAPAPNIPAAARQPQALAGTVDPKMTAALKKFMQDKGRLPQSILELAGAELDGVPPAPAGYIYVIDPATQQVKLAKP